MNLDAIRTFVEVIRIGSFAGAARGRGVAASSVSRTIAGLEREIGIRLFQRTTRRLSLTEAGQAYLRRVEPLLRELEQAAETARALGMRPRGLLRIAVAAPFASLHLARWLPGFVEQYPEIDLELVLDSRYADLVGERIDVAVRQGRLEAAPLIALKLCDVPRVVAASPAYLAGRALSRPGDLRGHRCLVFPRGGERETWRFRSATGQVADIEVRPRVAVPDGVVVRELARARIGPALLPRWLCVEALERRELVDVFPSYEVTATDFESSLWLVYSSRVHLPAKVRAFVSYMREVFREGAPWDRPTGGAGAGRAA